MCLAYKSMKPVRCHPAPVCREEEEFVEPAPKRRKLCPAKKASVSFGPQNGRECDDDDDKLDVRLEIFEIPSLQDFSEKEVLACWYQEDDYETFLSSSIHTINLHGRREKVSSITSSTKQSFESVTNTCMRGLERLTREGLRRFRSNHDEAIRAVLKEQSNLKMQQQQQASSSYQPLKIAQSYHTLCCRSQDHAAMQGEIDARNVLVEISCRQ